MGWLRTFLLWRILSNSKEKALAKRNQHGEPICAECRSVVDEQATKCTGCESSLYTRKGKFSRAVLSTTGILMILAGIVEGSITSTIGMIIGVGLLYAWFILRTDRPNRELKLSDRIPLRD